MDTQQTEQVFHDMSPSSSSHIFSKVVILFVVVILLGVGSGYVLAQYNTSKLPGGSASNGTVSASNIIKGATYGTNDTSTFKDSTEGVVQPGGIEGEGQFHLVRPGGDSQNVYMTSSLVDLSQFINRKVKVWGQTQKAQKAGWLMDVGKVEVES